MSGSGDAESRRMTLRRLVVVAAGILICSIPIMSAQFPHVLDYPGHLARVQILQDLPDSAFYQQLYERNPSPVPNMAFDVVVLMLAKFMPLQIAGKVFLILSLSIMVTGCMAVSMALKNDVTVWTLLSSVFAYGLVLQFGFLNYQAGVGLSLWALALWLYARNRSLSLRIGLALFWSLLLLVTHIIAFGLFIAVVGAFELQRFVEDATGGARSGSRRALVNLGVWAAVFTALAAAFLILRSGDISAGDSSAGDLLFKGVLWKGAVAVRTLMWDMGIVDLATALGLVMILVLLSVFGRIRVTRSLLGPLALLIVLFFAAPRDLLGGNHLDTRIPLVILLLLVSATRIEPRKTTGARLFAAALLLLVLARPLIIAYTWLQYDGQVREIVNGFKEIGTGQTVVLASGNVAYPGVPPVYLDLWHPPLHHVIAYATLSHPTFVPDIWADLSQHTIVRSPVSAALYEWQNNWARVAKDQGQLALIAEQASMLQADMSMQSDQITAGDLYILMIYPPALGDVGSIGLVPVARGRHFTLFKSDRQLRAP